MGGKDVLVYLWVLSAAVQISQASTGMWVSPNVTATCGQSITLHCNVSTVFTVSSEREPVFYLSWMKNNIPLCEVKQDRLVNEQPTSDVGVAKCRYANKSLFVTFRQTPKEQQERALDEYICKLRSYRGPAFIKTWVELKGQRPVECIQRVEPNVTADGPRCSFTGVRHDGDVHWYRENTRLTEDDAVFEKKENVDKECCLTIIGSLKPKKDPTGPYTCFLWNRQSQNYTINHTFQPEQIPKKSTSGSGMVHARWSIGNCLIISVLLMSL